MHLAALEDSYKTVVVLVTSGADITLRDVDGQTPLMICERTRNKQMIALIQESKATPPKSPKSKRARKYDNNKSSDQEKIKRKNENNKKGAKNKVERNTLKRKRKTQQETTTNNSNENLRTNNNRNLRSITNDENDKNLYETLTESLKLPTVPSSGGQQFKTEAKQKDLDSKHLPERQSDEEAFDSLLYDSIIQTFDAKRPKKDSFENHFADGLFTGSNVLNLTDQIPSIMTPPSSAWSPGSPDLTPEIFKF